MCAVDFDPRSYWDRRLKNDWTLRGTALSDLSYSFNKWMYRVRRDVFRRTIRKLPLDLRTADVLDVGPGTGFYIDQWQRLGARRVSGLDIAESAVERLRERFPGVPFECMDISDKAAAQLPGHFDIISSFDVLLHIVDDERFKQAIDNIYGLLVPGGWLVFSDPFPHRDGFPQMVHYSTRKLNEIERILRATGFEIVRRRPMIVTMTAPFDLTSKWRFRLWEMLVDRLTRNEWTGGAIGAVLFLAEMVLTRILRESPSMEIMVCRKPG
jgi:2-polyprenyl-3-methyl-5-hydroxy-6-metoxy-1,4-benzoquinol methylase